MAGDIGSVRPQRFAQGSHLNLDAAFDSGLFRQPAATGTEHPHPVRFIQKKPSPITVLQLHDLPERRNIPVHAVNRLGHDENTAVPCARPAQMTLQLARVIVWKNPQLRAAQPRGVDETGMAKLVENDDILAGAKRGDRPHRRRVTAGETQSGPGALESRDRLLQALVRRERPANQAGCARAKAGPLPLGHRGLPECRMARQPQIVVRGKINQRAATGNDMGGLRRFQNPQPPQ